MKLQYRNLQDISYQLYAGTEPTYDDYGNESGQNPVYADPVQIKCSISAAAGFSEVQLFGTLDDYDKVLVTDNLNCPIDENSVVAIEENKYNVRKVAKTLNFIFYAVKRAKLQ